MSEVNEPLLAGKELQTAVLQHVTFSVPRGSLVTIIGPSGGGKSSLLRLLNRLQDPERGVVEFEGKSLAQWDVLELRRRVRLVFQFPTMVEGTVLQNLTLVNQLARMPVVGREAAVEMMTRLGLPQEMLDRDASQLSGGQQARVALGRAVIDGPDVVLLDEVTASLDPDSKKLIEELVRDLQERRGTTVLWVTHDLEQAERMGQLTWVMAEGQLVETGRTEEIFRNPQHEVTRRWFRQGFEEQRDQQEQRNQQDHQDQQDQRDQFETGELTTAASSTLVGERSNLSKSGGESR